MFLEKLKERFDFNEPIFTNEILEMFNEYSKAYVFRLIDKAKKEGEIVNFDTGVYFLPKKSVIGLSTITAEDVVNKKYINYNDEVYGINSGLNLQNKFSLTTQMPNTIEIVTNKESMRCRKIVIDGRTVILRKSRCEINSSNVHAYTVLQLLSEMKDLTDIDKNVKEILLRYIKQNDVKNNDLISLASVFPAQTTKKLILSGVLNDFTQG